MSELFSFFFFFILIWGGGGCPEISGQAVASGMPEIDPQVSHKLCPPLPSRAPYTTGHPTGPCCHLGL